MNANSYGDASLGDQDSGAGDIEWARRLAPGIDGFMEEYWAQTRDGNNVLRKRGTAWNQLWDPWMLVPAALIGFNVDFYGVTYGPASMGRYAYASLLQATVLAARADDVRGLCE